MKNRKRNRKSGFDYSSDAVYFLTICVKDNEHHFGKIINKKMILNEYGKITETQIKWLEKQYPYFMIHNYIIMPNHIHILCEINTTTNENGNNANNGKIRAGNDNGNARTENGDGKVRAGNDNGDARTENGDGKVRTGRDLSLSSPSKKIKSISELMGAFKTTSSKKIHLAGNQLFQWQRSFHDHIVRNNISYQRIFNYITQNPEKWNEDTLNSPD